MYICILLLFVVRRDPTACCALKQYLENFGVHLASKRVREPVLIEPHNCLRGHVRSLTPPESLTVFTLRTVHEQRSWSNVRMAQAQSCRTGSAACSRRLLYSGAA